MLNEKTNLENIIEFQQDEKPKRIDALVTPEGPLFLYKEESIRKKVFEDAATHDV